MQRYKRTREQQQQQQQQKTMAILRISSNNSRNCSCDMSTGSSKDGNASVPAPSAMPFSKTSASSPSPSLRSQQEQQNTFTSSPATTTTTTTTTTRSVHFAATVNVGTTLHLLDMTTEHPYVFYSQPEYLFMKTYSVVLADHFAKGRQSRDSSRGLENYSKAGHAQCKARKQHARRVVLTEQTRQRGNPSNTTTAGGRGRSRHHVPAVSCQANSIAKVYRQVCRQSVREALERAERDHVEAQQVYCGESEPPSCCPDPLSTGTASTSSTSTSCCDCNNSDGTLMTASSPPVSVSPSSSSSPTAPQNKYSKKNKKKKITTTTTASFTRAMPRLSIHSSPTPTPSSGKNNKAKSECSSCGERKTKRGIMSRKQSSERSLKKGLFRRRKAGANTTQGSADDTLQTSQRPIFSR